MQQQLNGLQAMHGTAPSALIASYMEIRNAVAEPTSSGGGGGPNPAPVNNSKSTSHSALSRGASTRDAATNNEEQLIREINDWLTTTNHNIGRAAGVINLAIEFSLNLEKAENTMSFGDVVAMVTQAVQHFKTALKRVPFYHPLPTSNNTASQQVPIQRL